MAKNRCHDCNSTYRKPGTCNCFAPGGKRDPDGATTISVWTPCPICGGRDCWGHGLDGTNDFKITWTEC